MEKHVQESPGGQARLDNARRRLDRWTAEEGERIFARQGLSTDGEPLVEREPPRDIAPETPEGPDGGIGRQTVNEDEGIPDAMGPGPTDDEDMADDHAMDEGMATEGEMRVLRSGKVDTRFRPSVDRPASLEDHLARLACWQTESWERFESELGSCSSLMQASSTIGREIDHAHKSMLATLAEVRASLVGENDEDLSELHGLVKEHDLKQEAEECLRDSVQVLLSWAGTRERIVGRV